MENPHHSWYFPTIPRIFQPAMLVYQSVTTFCRISRWIWGTFHSITLQFSEILDYFGEAPGTTTETGKTQRKYATSQQGSFVFLCFFEIHCWGWTLWLKSFHKHAALILNSYINMSWLKTTYNKHLVKHASEHISECQQKKWVLCSFVSPVLLRSSLFASSKISTFCQDATFQFLQQECCEVGLFEADLLGWHLGRQLHDGCLPYWQAALHVGTWCPMSTLKQPRFRQKNCLCHLRKGVSLNPVLPK